MKESYEARFIEGVIKIVAKVGIENIRTKQIAEYAGVSEATLFRAFNTKEDVLRAAFLYVDKKISDILSKGRLEKNDPAVPFEQMVFTIWQQVYRYLLDNREETIFLIRYRYSSLYSDEVRGNREAYNGGFDQVYQIFEKHFGFNGVSYRGFIVNYMFEMTLCFAEKVISGKIDDTKETEYRIWSAVISAANAITGRTAAQKEDA